MNKILSGDTLGDEHMTFGQRLLNLQFPTLDGLQLTLLTQVKNGFNPVASDKDSIQIHHTGLFHWMTSASLNGTVYLYDSSFHGGPLSSSLQIQLAQIYKTRIEKEHGAESVAVQQQVGSMDCGVFAIPFAFYAGTRWSL